MDIELLSLVKKRELYIRFEPYVEDHLLGKECRLIYKTMGIYFKNFSALTEIDWDQFESYFKLFRHAQLKAENMAFYENIFAKLKAFLGTGGPAEHEVLSHYITADYCARIMELSQAVRDKKATIEELVELVHKCDAELGRAMNPDTVFVTASLEDEAKKYAMPGFNWRLEELNLSLGPLRDGDFIIVSARPETGKTTFLADQVGYMATQITDNRCVVWVNNEERSSKVLNRVKQAALCMTSKAMFDDPIACEEEYKRIMNGDANRVRVVDNSSGMNEVSRLNALFQDVKPAIIIFDQLDKVYGFKGEDREDMRITKLYEWARFLSHKYGPVFAASQADGTAENVKYIDQNQLANSKTGKPGEADAIITIGRTNEPGQEYKRFINVPKNKLIGGPRSDEARRHAKWIVDIQPTIARYRGNE